jgi:hypothetical protein
MFCLKLGVNFMVKLKVLGGDFLDGDGEIKYGSFVLKNKETLIEETIPITELENIEIAGKENTSKIIKEAIQLGASFLLGNGLLGLLVLPTSTSDIIFVAKLKDGRIFIGMTDKKEFDKLKIAAFNNSW